MQKSTLNVSIIGAGTIGTALGNIIAYAGNSNIILHSIERDVVDDINKNHLNIKYFPTIHLHPDLKATTDNSILEKSDFIFLAIPSTVLIDYLESIRDFIYPDAILINLAKGFGCGHKTIFGCLSELFPNKICTFKGPSFAREIINRIPTAFTLGTADETIWQKVSGIFNGSTIYLDFTDDAEGVEILSILKNIYAIVMGIVDAHFNSPNIRFLILTKAFREMRNVLLQFGGKEDTIFKYCGYGDFTLTALNDLSRNRTLGLLIGKGFFTENVSHELVLEGQIAVNVFYEEISKFRDVSNEFPIISELYKIFNQKYDISDFVKTLLKF